MTVVVRHVGLVVRDLERSLAFYRDIIGLRIRSRMTESGDFIEKIVGIEGAVLEWAKLEADTGETLVELIEYKNATARNVPIRNAPSDRLGYSHVAFTVTNIDHLYGMLQTSGLDCNSAPQVSSDGLAKVMYCHDPDGVIVELVEMLKQQQ